MNRKLFFSGFLVSVFFLLLSCATLPDEYLYADYDYDYTEYPDEVIGWPVIFDEYFLPAGITFVPQEFPSIAVPPGVGFVTTYERDRAATLSQSEREALATSFRSAYTSSLFRQYPLDGALGGDFVHDWPAANLPAWVQNWQSLTGQPNSWGIPSLVLAIKGFGEEAEIGGGRVFVVRGRVLDQYGRGGGIRGANGVTGYGSPRGYEFLREGKLAQRFDFGLITVDREGHGVFLPEEPPSSLFDPPLGIGYFTGVSVPTHDIQAAFVTAWKMALDRGVEIMAPDGPGRYLSFLEEASRLPADFPDEEVLSGVYVQTFNQQTILLVLPNSPTLPPYPRFISSLFLEALLSVPDPSLPPEESLLPAAFSDGGFYRAILRGLVMYGIPLTDPMPIPSEEYEAVIWRNAQRFSRGWLVKSSGNGEYEE